MTRKKSNDNNKSPERDKRFSGMGASLEGLAMDYFSTLGIVFTFGHPDLLERIERSQNRATSEQEKVSSEGDVDVRTRSMSNRDVRAERRS